MLVGYISLIIMARLQLNQHKFNAKIRHLKIQIITDNQMFIRTSSSLISDSSNCRRIVSNRHVKSMPIIPFCLRTSWKVESTVIMQREYIYKVLKNWKLVFVNEKMPSLKH